MCNHGHMLERLRVKGWKYEKMTVWNSVGVEGKGCEVEEGRWRMGVEDGGWKMGGGRGEVEEGEILAKISKIDSKQTTKKRAFNVVEGCLWAG